MSEFLTAIALGLVIGGLCRWLQLPVPAPPHLAGALLVVAVTLGYQLADRWLSPWESPEKAALDARPEVSRLPARRSREAERDSVRRSHGADWPGRCPESG